MFCCAGGRGGEANVLRPMKPKTTHLALQPNTNYIKSSISSTRAVYFGPLGLLDQASTPPPLHLSLSTHLSASPPIHMATRRVKYESRQRQPKAEFTTCKPHPPPPICLPSTYHLRYPPGLKLIYKPGWSVLSRPCHYSTATCELLYVWWTGPVDLCDPSSHVAHPTSQALPPHAVGSCTG